MNQTTPIQRWRVTGDNFRLDSDRVATEEPLELRLVDSQQTIAITMRTPGHDFELAAGFLYGEGVIRERGDLRQMRYCSSLDRDRKFNTIDLELKETRLATLPSLDRHVFTHSGCGVCGKTSLENLKQQGLAPLPNEHSIALEVIYSLPEKLRSQQAIFQATGGLHAAALFDLAGNLLKIREDVGRHNAVDKLIGSAFLADELPLCDRMMMVSGRLSFEILQKCIAARIPVLCAVSAPSSLAVTLAQAFNLTLIGFLRDQRCNVYSGVERLLSRL